MRILHLTDSMSNTANGINNVVVDLATAQAAAGHDVTVSSAGGDYHPLLHRHGVSTRVVDFSRRTARTLPATISRLRGVVRDTDPDVVHVHTLTPAVLLPLAARRVPSVATVHNEYQRGVAVMALADVVVCVSRANELEVTRRWPVRGRTTTIHNAVLGSVRRPGDVVPVELARPAVVALGSVTRRKGSDLLVGAFGRVAERHPDAHLYFVGNVDDPGTLTARDGQAWADRVHTVGSVADPRPWLAGADVAVMASRQEPFGLVVVEEREAGLACIVSSSDGLPEVVDGGEAGLVVPREDVDALARALGDVLSDESLRRDLQRRASANLDRFRVSRMSDDYLAVYRRAAAGRGARRTRRVARTGADADAR